ncbi:MAG: hypothetical protein JSW66_09290 [Phycisphaerales bacterium]|nr:MAG: hypothetical protein JSW66_09290 [Phycisphaerales bacterium]
MKRFMILLIVVASSVGTTWAITNVYSRRVVVLSEQILFRAEELVDVTHAPVLDSARAEGILAELKGFVKEYEATMVLAESPYAGEVLLGTTPAGDSTWLETLCTPRYDGPLKEIRLRRTGHRARYLRINDIEVTYSTPTGLQTETFNKAGRVRLYHSGVFKLALPRPMRVHRIRININHESTGLEVCGIPYELPIPLRSVPTRYPGEVLLGTTPGGDDSWLDTLCSGSRDRPVREIRIRRTGNKASYLRINDIEITYLTPRGMRKEVFNENAGARLYRGGVFKLALPRPMRIMRIRIRVNHETTGLEVYGVH